MALTHLFCLLGELAGSRILNRCPPPWRKPLYRFAPGKTCLALFSKSLNKEEACVETCSREIVISVAEDSCSTEAIRE